MAASHPGPTPINGPGQHTTLLDSTRHWPTDTREPSEPGELLAAWLQGFSVGPSVGGNQRRRSAFKRRTFARLSGHGLQSARPGVS
jgi:hypothetical protein